jgi:putative zinc finger/helix-turn-helix YgiT family protein
MIKYCPECDMDRECFVEAKKEVYPVRGEKIEVESHVCVCSVCGKDIFDEELDSENLQKAYAVYREKYGLLSPDEIRAIRERYGLSQRGLSRLLGWGDVTLHRYESGALPDRVHSDMLRMISTPDGMLKYLEQQKGVLPEEEVECVRRALAQSAKLYALKNRFKHTFELLQSEFGPSIETGYRLFDMDRLKNMVLFLAEGGVWKTKLNKLLWYADFLAFRRLSCSLSGLAYQRYTRGPMPFHVYSMLDVLEDDKVVTLDEIVFPGGNEGTLIRPLREADFSCFSAEEIDVLQFVRDYFKDYNSRDISDFSHRERAWIEVPQSEIIPYHYAFQLSLE